MSLAVDPRGVPGVLRLDAPSGLVEVDAALPLRALEARLQAEGATLGPLSPAAWSLDVRRFLEGPHAGLRAIPGGRLETAALALCAELPGGERARYRSRESPRSAAGPSLDALILGGEGRAGRVVSATLRIFPLPTSHQRVWLRLRDGQALVRLLTRALAAGAWAWEAELARDGAGFRLTLELRGSSAAVQRDQEHVGRLAAQVGGERLGRPPKSSPPPPSTGAGLPEHEWPTSELPALTPRQGRLALYRLSVESVLAVGPGLSPRTAPEAEAAPRASADTLRQRVLEALEPARGAPGRRR